MVCEFLRIVRTDVIIMKMYLLYIIMTFPNTPLVSELLLT